MKEGLRSGGSSEVVVKNRSSSGCLVVRRKGDALDGGHGSSESRKVYMSKKEKKRRRMLTSDSGSSDEVLATPRRSVGPETVRVCNDLTSAGKSDDEESELGRKRERLEGVRRNEDGFVGNSGLDENERKRAKLDVFDFNEYESGTAFGGRGVSGSMHMGRSDIDRDFEAGSSRHGVDKRKNAYFEQVSSMNRENRTGKSRFEDSREGSLSRDKFAGSSDQAIRLQGKNGVLKVLVNKKKGRAAGSLEKYNFHKAEEHVKASRAENTVKKNVVTPLYPKEKISKKPVSAVRSEKKLANTRKSLPSKRSKNSNWDSEDSDTSLKPEPEKVVRSSKRVSVRNEDPPREKITPKKTNEGKVKRGSGTEKQKLRERIRGMLTDAGWTIDYRPRRNRDYLDAVYINPSGTAYWSIIKAYDAFQKQVNEEDNEPKPSADGSALQLIANEDLCQLTRNTRKKMEKEMKRKQIDGSDSENANEAPYKRSTNKKYDSDSMDSPSHDGKINAFTKQSAKSSKSRANENGFTSANSNGRNLQDAGEGLASGSSSQMLHGRKSRKDGRCTLLVRGSNKGQNSETDGFVPYTGKRTVLSWLIDSGTVHLSQKVQYKSRRRSRVVLEGWITRDGIHCGCCSKILTVSKFELHAGSKLRQPYQNIFLDSGVSLMQCQIDAWNKQEGSEHTGFHSVDIDGDDPNDDTCGICGDGGDLICCDGCPSTFHQSCLDIEMLPPGDWHCPNCTCKFCGIAIETLDEEDDTATLSCSLCEKKFHESCVQDIDASSSDSSSTDPSFCGKKCKELFEHLQKYVGAKHDLEAGFSWSLIRRTDEDSKNGHRGIPHRVECNSKLAVGMTVMDECFLPVFDRRSGINLIRNVLYNCGSNFNRLNYSGFYTAILERGDEIICAASLRFHGTKLAEMPFIGTRHIYRRQGMCRRLFSIIESALCSLKVERLVIPAISELIHTWTEVFGFTPVEESLKNEMRSMSMLVFPGIHMLKKIIGEQEHKADITIKKDANEMECNDEKSSKPGPEVKPDIDILISNGCDDTVVNQPDEPKVELAAVESDSQGVTAQNNSDVSISDVATSVKPEIDSPSRRESRECADPHLNCANKTTEEVAAVVEFGSPCIDVKNEGDVSDSNAVMIVKPETDSSIVTVPQECEVTDLNLSNVSTMEDFAVEFDPVGVNMSKEIADTSGAEISGTTADCKSSSHNSVPGLVLEDVVNSEPLNNGNLCTSASDSPGNKISETISDLTNISPSKPSCDDVVTENEPLPEDALTSVLLNVSSKIENPGPVNNETDILSSKSPSKMTHGGGNIVVMENIHVQDSSVEVQTES